MPGPIGDASDASSASSGSSFTLLPRPRWTKTSIAAVGSCILFAVSVGVAGMIHPQIPAALVGAIVVLPLAASVLGAIAQFRSRAAPARGAKMAMQIGCVAFVLTLLTLILLPTLCRAREPANRVKCASNLRQIGQAIAAYVDSHGGHFPPTFQALAAASDLTPAVFACPSSNDEPATILKSTNWANAFQPESHHLSYIYVASDLTASTISPASILAYENLHDHLDEGMNVLFGDYHVEWVNKWEADRIIAARPTSNALATRPGSESHEEPQFK